MFYLIDFCLPLTGDNDFLLGESVCSNPKEATLFFPHHNRVELYFPPSKKSRVSAPFLFNGDRLKPKQQQKSKVSIEVLHDECLFEVFRRLSGDQERMACASVSKRWLTLLSNISRGELCTEKTSEPEDLVSESEGHLTRVLEGKKATDIRLAAISVGAAARGGLGKLVIRGNNSARGITDSGLRAIARGCPSLQALSLSNVPSVGNEGLSEIGSGCQQLEKLELHQCHGISDKGLVALAKGCPKLTDLTLESCSKIGNESLQALALHCPNLTSISIRYCPLVGDQGITHLLSGTSYSLSKLKLQGINVTDMSLAVIGHYGKALTEVVLDNLPNVGEKGFWVMGNGHGLQKLKSLMVSSCQGVTDQGLQAVVKGCPNLKYVSLKKCAYISDSGLIASAKSASSLERVQLEECHRVTQCGFFGLLVHCAKTLKSLSVSNCMGIKDLDREARYPPLPLSESLLLLSVKNCPLFGDTNLAMLAKLCPNLNHIELSGLQGITDEGLLPLLKGCDSGLSTVNLSKCPQLTDKVICSLTEMHGWTLEVLNLDSCHHISDKSLVAIAENCPMLNDLDISHSAVSDLGVAALDQVNLQILSLAGCPNVSNRSLPALRELGLSLLGLNLQNCKGISSNGVHLLNEYLSKCDILY